MNTQEVANRLVELCRQGQYAQAMDELYDPNVVSHEPEAMGWPASEGLDAVRAKSQQWEESVEEVHSAWVSEPVVAGDHFAITMKNDITFKERGRAEIQEVCVYEVANGKIVKENFFYNM